MFDHVLMRVSDHAASRRFLDTVLEPLGIEYFEPLEAISRWSNLGITQADVEHPVTRRLHVGLSATSRECVDAFWHVGVDAGYRDAGKPGPRPEYGDDYYGGFLLDPDGNSIEAVHHDNLPRVGAIDHLWIRVADVAAARRFYATIASHTGFRLLDDTAQRARFGSAEGSFTVLGGAPTNAVHIAFDAGDEDTVRAFHAAATAAGYRDNGAPGERPVYGPGYYGAFVLDPDQNNIEVVSIPDQRAAGPRSLERPADASVVDAPELRDLCATAGNGHDNIPDSEGA